jgi:hypothetical protein
MSILQSGYGETIRLGAYSFSKNSKTHVAKHHRNGHIAGAIAVFVSVCSRTTETNICSNVDVFGDMERRRCDKTWKSCEFFFRIPQIVYGHVLEKTRECVIVKRGRE